MSYKFNSDNKDITKRILEINNINENEIDVSNFVVDDETGLLESFKQFLIDNANLKYLIIGDYDCDGICATTIIKSLLDDLNIYVKYYIPSRSKQGYGISEDNVLMAKDNGFDAIIMVDNGVACFSEIELATSFNIKTIVIDHHEYTDQVKCDLFIHPNLFPNKYNDMCAAGLCALLSNYIRQDDLTTVLGGLSSLADVVSVLNYNRYLILKMYEILQNVDIYPIKYLLADNPLSYTSLCFNVIPKINAISRLDKILNVNFMVQYLLADEKTCKENIIKIEAVNEIRKQISKQMYEKALSLIDINDDIFVIYDESFLEGLCGVLASRILNEFRKPVIVLAKLENEYKASARSLMGFNIYEYMSKFKNNLKAFGGHEQAIGFSFEIDKYDDFINYIKNNHIEEIEYKNDVLLIDEKDVNFDTYRKIEALKPFGPDFKLPLLGIENLRYSKKFLIKQRYPKFIVNEVFDAISFKSNLNINEFRYMIGKLEIDNYRANKLSFLIEDLII